MLNRSEQPDATASECGATGGFPHSPAGRANLSLDRDHWSFDPVAYRDTLLSRAYSPGVISSVLVLLTGICTAVMIAVALGAR